MKTHYLKTWPGYFEALKTGLKTFEVRYNDRDYNIDDTVICQEFDPETKRFTGQELEFVISYKACWNDDVIMGNALKVNYCILGLKKIIPILILFMLLNFNLKAQSNRDTAQINLCKQISHNVLGIFIDSLSMKSNSIVKYGYKENDTIVLLRIHPYCETYMYIYDTLILSKRYIR